MWDREVKSVTLACVYYLGPKNTVYIVIRDPCVPDGIIGNSKLSPQPSRLLYFTILKHYFDDSLHPRFPRIP